MNNRTWRQARTSDRGEPTPLLRHLAGSYAPRIAGLWPAPHAEFLGASADRRHLVCLAIDRLGSSGALDLANDLLTWPLKQALRSVTADAPPGLARALGRIGEVAWTPDNYRCLIEVLSQGRLANPLLHAKLIEPGIVTALNALPRSLRECGLARRPLTLDQVLLLREVFEALIRREGETVARQRACGWAGASSSKDLFTRVQADLIAEFPPPPFEGSDKLVPILTKGALIEAAGRYRNCARDYLASTSEGNSAFYEWTGRPNVLVQLSKDSLVGWAFDEARIADNAAVPPDSRAAVIEELRSWGVHVGRLSWHVAQGLRNAHQRDFRFESVEEAIDNLFGGD
jgi:hypothetical protein